MNLLPPSSGQKTLLHSEDADSIFLKTIMVQYVPSYQNTRFYIPADNKLHTTYGKIVNSHVNCTAHVMHATGCIFNSLPKLSCVTA